MNNSNKITLAIMVKDEEINIIKTLESCTLYVDKVVMYDTGSKDKTIQVAKEFCDKNSIQLYLMEGNFESYTTSRNKLLDYTETIVPLNHFYMIMDANDELRATYDFVDNLQRFVPLSTCVVMVNSKWKVSYSITTHIKILFIRSGCKVRYDGGIHEYLKINNQPLVNKLFIEGVELFQDRVNDENKTLRRAMYDVGMLKKDIQDNKYVGRNIYLLGRTYFNIKQYKKALKYLDMGVDYYKNNKGYMDIEEKYMCHYYLAIVKKNLGLNWIPHVFSGYELVPTKIECILFLCLYLSMEANWNTLYLFAKEAITIAKNKYQYSDIAHNETDYKIYCWYYHTLACLYLGRIKEGLKSIRVIDTNISNYEQILDIRNDADFGDIIYKYNYLKSIYLPLETLNKNVLDNNIVLFGGLGYYKWNGESINGPIGLGGAETVVTNLANQFYIKLGKLYNIVVFCDTDENIFFNGVYYIKLELYDVFMIWRNIKTLFVFRYTNALRYSPNIENVVLVLEDISPIGNQIECNSKLSKIVVKTEWHKEELLRIVPSFNNIHNKICVIGNGLDIGRFIRSNKVDKIPWRFIYSSCMTRGLYNLLNMWPKIKDLVPEATLHLFITYDCPYYQPHHKIDLMIQMIEQMKELGVYRHPRVSQESLAQEIAISEVWLYPTEFKETFCITALEMQAGKVLCVCSNLAGLKETVNDRGILVDYTDKDNNKDNGGFLNAIKDIRDGMVNKDQLIHMGYEWAIQQDWNMIGKRFINIL